MDNVRELSNEMLIANLDKRVEFESENEAEIVDYVREVMERQMWGDLGADSIYDFLTRARYTYPRNIAMRKLDAARVMQSFPYIKKWIYDGELNLSQISAFQTAIRQKPASPELQAEVLDEIRNHTLENTQFILCEKLGLEIKKKTKVRIQRDGSMRVEITFSAEQWQNISRAKDILSHCVPSGDLCEVLDYCARFTADKKDPAAPAKKSAGKTKSQTQKESRGKMDDSVKKSDTNCTTTPPNFTPESGVSPRHPRKVTRASRRVTFQKHNGCQFRHPNGTLCGSRYQLQVDHIVSLWAGGSNDPENLQILCGVHNREKFRREADVDMNWPPPPPHDQ